MSTPLRELITRLADDPSARSAFAAEPAAFLRDHGWSDLDGDDVGTALQALVRELPIDRAVRLDAAAADAGGYGTGLDGAIAGLDAAASSSAGLGDGPDVAADALADPALVLDGGTGDPDDGLALDPAEGIDDVGANGGDLAAGPAGRADEVEEVDEVDDGVDIRPPDGAEHLDDGEDGEPTDDFDAPYEPDEAGVDGLAGPDDEAALTDPFEALDPAEGPGLWTQEAPQDDDAVTPDEPTVDDAT